MSSSPCSKPGWSISNSNSNVSAVATVPSLKQITWQFDMCRFAERLRNYEAIWNVKCRDYGNRDKRKAQFKDLGDEFGLTAEAVECKYHSMRTYYVKQKKKTQVMLKKTGQGGQSSADVFTPVWPPYKLLSFLDDTIDQRAPKDSSAHSLDVNDNNHSPQQDACDANADASDMYTCEDYMIPTSAGSFSTQVQGNGSSDNIATTPSINRADISSTQGDASPSIAFRRRVCKVARESQSDEGVNGTCYPFEEDGSTTTSASSSLQHAGRAKHARIEADVGAFMTMLGHQLSSVRHPLRRMQIMHRLQGIILEELLRGSSPQPVLSPAGSVPTTPLYQTTGTNAYLIRHTTPAHSPMVAAAGPPPVSPATAAIVSVPRQPHHHGNSLPGPAAGRPAVLQNGNDLQSPTNSSNHLPTHHFSHLAPVPKQRPPAGGLSLARPTPIQCTAAVATTAIVPMSNGTMSLNHCEQQHQQQYPASMQSAVTHTPGAVVPSSPLLPAAKDPGTSASSEGHNGGPFRQPVAVEQMSTGDHMADTSGTEQM